MRTHHLLLPLVFAIAACDMDRSGTTDTSGATASAAAMSDPAADRTEIERIRSAWQEAANRKDAAAVAAFYSDDASYISSEGQPALGRAAVQTALGEFFPISSVESIDSRELIVDGDLAYDYGTYRIRMTPPRAQPQTINGYYAVILRRQSDGTWKLVRHFDVVPPPATAPAR